MRAIMSAISIHKLRYGMLVIAFACKGAKAAPQNLLSKEDKITTTNHLSMKKVTASNSSSKWDILSMRRGLKIET